LVVDAIDVAFIAKSSALDNDAVPAASPCAAVVPAATMDGGAIPVSVLAASPAFLDSDAIADAASSEAVFLAADEDIPR
jgi:hypothetical protein